MVRQLEDAARENAITDEELRSWVAFLGLPQHGKKKEAELPASLWPAADRLLLWQCESPSEYLH